MNAESLRTPALFFPERVAVATVGEADRYAHRFGGPLSLAFDRWPHGLPAPHRVVTLDLHDPTLLYAFRQAPPPRVAALPLVYGFRLDGCRMRYQMIAEGHAKLLEVKGSGSDDWPYPDYGHEFPQVPLAFRSSRRIDWKRYENEDSSFSLTWQHSRPEAGELLVVVPPNDAYGVSLWGEDGDAERVQTVFRVDVASLTIEAWNECY